MSEILLDTCACIWLLEGCLTDETRAELDQRVRQGEELHVSAATAWEVGMLLARGRMTSPLGPEQYFAQLMEPEFMRLAPAQPHVLIRSNYLPGEPPRDPWDRILVATARELGLILMTGDRELLRYAASGNLRALPAVRNPS
jgi:PIN domain nuclease of toxin-antitoxin system